MDEFRPSVWLACLGGILGGCAPIAYGVQILAEFQQPLPKNVARCGLMPLGTMAMMVFGPAIVAPLVAMVGYFIGSCWELRRIRELEELDAWGD